MNKKAFFNPIGVILAYLIFLALWFFAFAEAINYWAQFIIEFNSLVGLEAFLMANMNFWVFIISTIGVIAGVYMGGGD